MKYLLTLSLSLAFFIGYAQGNNGLIAHWDMNGETLDSTGNGHDGTGHNITPATGEDGIPGHAYYFNGTDSWISVPYSPDFNVTNFSICARVKVQGFYTGTCQGNVIFTRGKTGTGVGTYTLFFNDKAGDGYDCYGLDTTKEDFITGTGSLYSANQADYNYTPYIVEDTWYNLVTTFNDTSFKMYVNDTLKYIVNVSNPGTPIGISIGYNTFEQAFPYGFNGVIDDIRLYNRALADSEIITGCGTIAYQPQNDTVITNNAASFHVTTSISSPQYQWQKETGNSFVNLANTPPYSGVNSSTLFITNASSQLNHSLYRCQVSNDSGCSATTQSAELVLATEGVDNYLAEHLSIYPNPAHDNIVISLPGNHEKGNVVLINTLGQIISQQDMTGSKVDIDMANLPSGLYIVKCYVGGHTLTRKISKQ